MFKLIALSLLVACGGAQHPRSTGMKELAAEIDAESAELARIVREVRTDCPRMTAELKALFARMSKTFDRAHTAQKDPALAKELTTHLRAYDEAAKKRNAELDADFAANSCTGDSGVRDAIDTMPTL